ncbi:MAG: CHC2 zinc finger domain-containing protein [Patescibacteria group bacterium]
MSDDTVHQIKERLSIVDVVMPYVKLTKSGKYYKGLSPFTKEKTASFFVSPDRGLYHCFSSGKGGDMFTFIEEMEGVDFRGALHTLAEKAGVVVVKEAHGARDLREKVYAALTDANAYFQKQYETHPEVFAYLESRAVKKETAEAWMVGFAPDSWRGLSEHLQSIGHAESVLLDAGLIKRPESNEQPAVSNEQSATSNQQTASSNLPKQAARPYDRFRNRIMFPIHDTSGRVVGFSGRAFGSGDALGAKYLNSPETSVFNKSRLLYGLHAAKEGIRKYGFAILVEGQFDLLMAHQAGYTNAMALSGTAFTKEHALLIRRYSQNLLIAFDGDRAGIAAAGRAAQVSLPEGLNVKIASFPPGEDPADIIKRDPEAWKLSIKQALPVVDFYLSTIKNSGFDERRFKLEVSRVVLPYIPLIENAIDRAHFTERVASALSVPLRAVEIELEKITKTTSSQRSASSNQRTETHSIQTVSAVYEPFLSRSDTLERLLFGVSKSLEGGEHASLSEHITKALERLLGSERMKEMQSSKDEARVAVIEGDLFLETHEKTLDKAALVDELLGDFEKELLRTKYREATALLREAEKRNDAAEVERLVGEISVLAKTL